MAEEYAPVDIKDVEKKLAEMHIQDLEVSGGRPLKQPFSIIVAVLGVITSLFHIYVLTIHPIDPWYFRTTHVVLGGILLFAIVPAARNLGKDQPHLVDYLCMLMLIAPAVYIFSVFDEWIYRQFRGHHTHHTGALDGPFGPGFRRNIRLSKATPCRERKSSLS